MNDRAPLSRAIRCYTAPTNEDVFSAQYAVRLFLRSTQYPTLKGGREPTNYMVGQGIVVDDRL